MSEGFLGKTLILGLTAEDNQTIDLQLLEVHFTKNNHLPRLVVSDGINKTQLAAISPALNHLFIDNEINELDIFRVSKYETRELANGKKSLIIHHITDYIKINNLIGNPTFVPTDSVFACDTQEKCLESCLSNNEVTLIPETQAQMEIPAISIKSLSLITKAGFAIRAKLINHSGVRTWANKNGSGHFSNLILEDFSGKIKATCFNTDCYKFANLHLAETYVIENFKIKKSDLRFRVDPSQEFELILNENSIFNLTDSLKPLNDVINNLKNLDTISFFGLVVKNCLSNNGNRVIEFDNDEEYKITLHLNSIYDFSEKSVLNICKAKVTEVSFANIKMIEATETKISINNTPEGRKLKANFLKKKIRNSRLGTPDWNFGLVPLKKPKA